MKRALGLILVVIAGIAGGLSIRGTMPFMPVFGSSMEPTLHTGSLIIIEPVSAGQIQMGDIVVYNVPGLIREHYNYPPVVAHRVIRISTERGLAFRTKGDNTGEDPFTIMPWDIRGKVGNQIPYIGFPLLFMQSQQGEIFIIISLALLALFLYSRELGLAGKRAQRGVFAPVIEETYRNSRVLTSSIESTEKRMSTTEQALEKFAAAVELYGRHLASHTSAIQGLSQASQELSKSAAEQNKVLAHLMRGVQTVELPRQQAIPGVEILPVPAKAAQAEKTYPPGCVRNRKVLEERLN